MFGRALLCRIGKTGIVLKKGTVHLVGLSQNLIAKNVEKKKDRKKC